MVRNPSESATDGGIERDWSAGFATDTITPDPDDAHRLIGFGAREGTMDGVDEDLHVKALALEDETGRRTVLLTYELLFVLPAQRELVAEHCAERWDVERDAVVINPSHTHYAPAYGTRPEALDADPEQGERLTAEFRARVDETLTAVVDRAFGDLEPARLTHGRSSCAMGMCRRRPKEDQIHFGPNPDGPTDDDVDVLAVETEAGLKGILFGYACHPTAGAANRNMVNGDWAGYAMRYLEEAHPGATAMFLIGCAGDQKAYPQGTQDLVKQHARTLTNAVEVGLETGDHRVTGPLKVLGGETTLDVVDDDGRTADEFDYPIQAVAFGSSLTLLSLSGEVMADYARQLKAALDGPLWVAAYANKCGYIPTRRVLAEGGYEARRSGYDGRYAPSTEDRVVSKALALAERVGATRR